LFQNEINKEYFLNINHFQANLSKLATLTIAKVRGNGVNVYWWDGVKNFGDLLTPEILRAMKYTPIESYLIQHPMIAIGSLIQTLPMDFHGKILGTGLIEPKRHDLSSAEFVFVRGDYTKKCMGLDNSLPVGDLGLLSDKLLLKPVKKKYQVGIVPHYVDKNSDQVSVLKEYFNSSGTVIDVQNSARNVVNQIAQCDIIVSSSLHGLVVADSLGIPNIWVEFSNSVAGEGFKFKDYNSAIDYEQSPTSSVELISPRGIEKNASNKCFSIIQNKKLELENLLRNAIT
jgi:pyruvyltransferase